MNSLGELERDVWKQITEATQKRQSARLARLGAIADEMETKKRDWMERLEKPGEPPSSFQAPPGGADFTNRSIRGFTLSGTHVPVHTYKELIVSLANLLRKKHGQTFDQRALSMRGRKRVYFATDHRRLKFAAELEGGSLFVETNLNANLVVKICYEMVAELGYPPATLSLL